MSETIEARLRSMGIELPSAAPPAANYVPYLVADGQLFVSGQLPMAPDGIAFTGKLGATKDIAEGKRAARLCAVNIFAQAKSALGDLERIKQIVRITGYVNATPDFADHPAVINGASDFIVEALGHRGRHTRVAIGSVSLPFDATVEIDAVITVA